MKIVQPIPMPEIEEPAPPTTPAPPESITRAPVEQPVICPPLPLLEEKEPEIVEELINDPPSEEGESEIVKEPPEIILIEPVDPEPVKPNFFESEVLEQELKDSCSDMEDKVKNAIEASKVSIEATRHHMALVRSQLDGTAKGIHCFIPLQSTG